MFFAFIFALALCTVSQVSEAAYGTTEYRISGNELCHVYHPGDDKPAVQAEFKDITLTKDAEVYFQKHDGTCLKLVYEGKMASLYEADGTNGPFVESKKDVRKYINIADDVFNKTGKIRKNTVPIAEETTSKIISPSDFF